MEDQIDAYLKSMESFAYFMGTVLIQRKGQTLLCKGYGKATAGSRNVPSTVFQIASLTKQFTAAAIMALHEEGKIDLESPVNRYLPSCCQCRTWNDVEVGHLLSHRSGISDYTDCDDYWKICKHLTPDKVIENAQDEDLNFPPGSDFCYSNTGYDLLGKIIEQITRLPYGEFTEQRILKPAGMKNSGIRKPQDAPGPNAAAGYYVDDLTLSEDPRNEFSVLYADGAMYSTVGDLALWSEVLDGNGTVLRPESVKRMIADEYGLMVDQAFGTQRIHHNGSMAGFRSDFCKFPEEDLTLIILGNNNDFVVEYLSSRISPCLLQNKPLRMPLYFPKNYDYSPWLTTFYWGDDEEDDGEDDEEEDDEEFEEEEDEDDDEDDEYTFELYRDRLVLQGDNPTECILLSDGRLFNPSGGEEYQLRKDGALLIYDWDGKKEGSLFSD